jgi:hypothetical protein
MAVVGGQFQAIPAKPASSGGGYILLKKKSIQTGTEVHLSFRLFENTVEIISFLNLIFFVKNYMILDMFSKNNF